MNSSRRCVGNASISNICAPSLSCHRPRALKSSSPRLTSVLLSQMLWPDRRQNGVVWSPRCHAWLLHFVSVLQTVGKYMIEIWKATGMDMNNVEFLWASEEVCVCVRAPAGALAGFGRARESLDIFCSRQMKRTW